MNFIEDSYKRWLCPTDRELTLRAKLRAGWSSKTNADATSTASISEAEQATIMQVLEKARRMQEMEEERNRQLTERLEKMKKQACGTGKKNCVLCNDQPRFFSKFSTCKDCANAVCSKCSIDTYELNSADAIWLCKICFESREVLKKTNMWLHMPAHLSPMNETQ